MTVRTAKKSIADLSEVITALLIFPPLGYLATGIERVDEGVEIRPVVRN